METVWPAKPKVFAIWAFVGSLPTCGLDRQGDDSGVRTQLTEGQRHGLGGESYQWEGGASPEKRRSEERGSDRRGAGQAAEPLGRLRIMRKDHRAGRSEGRRNRWGPGDGWRATVADRKLVTWPLALSWMRWGGSVHLVWNKLALYLEALLAMERQGCEWGLGMQSSWSGNRCDSPGLRKLASWTRLAALRKR